MGIVWFSGDDHLRRESCQQSANSRRGLMTKKNLLAPFVMLCLIVITLVSSFEVANAMQIATLQHFITEPDGDNGFCAGYSQLVYTDGCTLIVEPMSTVPFGAGYDPCCIPGWTPCGYWCASGACDLYWKAINAQSVLGTACSVGIGTCKRDGLMVCAQDGAQPVCSAVPGTPAPTEVCDGNDHNCNGVAYDGCPKPEGNMGTPCMPANSMDCQCL